ncbi:GGDEF domain-containing protein [Alkalimonas delamerensis]|uniref:GGDEF domain-containing protein n=1 Tax=Alkalimonas delamerensis TaxID=265981 RepID=A0ABT9GLZ3_9GAMM|nr:GGDEF domain-containing protein [Alkalimonas delamerensis]MDP4527969.1 GGDEF domain-containing protein [Alkalimonas delamerensis]
MLESTPFAAKAQDPLTKLANRALYLNTLETVVHSYNETKLRFGLFLINLENFKQLNKSTSYHFGDLVLLHVAERLQQHFGPIYELARVGGNEFAVLWPLLATGEDTTSPDLSIAATQLFNLIALPIKKSGYHCELGIKIGVCLLDPKLNAKQWLQGAEIALRHAQNDAENHYHVYYQHPTQ